jgi:hypothetical protein
MDMQGVSEQEWSPNALDESAYSAREITSALFFEEKRISIERNEKEAP